MVYLSIVAPRFLSSAGTMELLTTEEASRYLRLSDRKLYELIANGEIPCTKVTGRWLFPRAALDQWLASGMICPAGMSFTPPAPTIICGSIDTLLDWALRESNCGLGSLYEGSSAGLERLQKRESIAASIHLHTIETDDQNANTEIVARTHGLGDAVVIAFARRHQGLIVAPGNPHGLTDLASVAATGARLAQRPPNTGTQLLTVALIARAELVGKLKAVSPPFATGRDIADAIRARRVDCGIAPLSVAQTAGLDFIPLVWERFDLVFRMRDYFRPEPQSLISFMASAHFRDHAQSLGGYDVSEAGRVRAEPTAYS